jgi:hypothetical protein
MSQQKGGGGQGFCDSSSAKPILVKNVKREKVGSPKIFKFA